MFALQTPQLFQKIFAHCIHIIQQLLFLKNLHIGNRCSRPARAAAKSGDVTEVTHRISGVGFEFIEHSFGCHCARYGRIARGNSLGHRYNIRLNTKLLIAKPSASAAHATHHFINDQQHRMLFTNLLHPLPVSFRWNDDTATSHYGLKDNSAYSVSTFAQDYLFNRIGGADAIIFYVAPL